MVIRLTLIVSGYDTLCLLFATLAPYTCGYTCVKNKLSQVFGAYYKTTIKLIHVAYFLLNCPPVEIMVIVLLG